MSLFDLRAGYRTLYQYLKGKICEKYAPKAAAREIADLNDELPGDLGAPKPNGPPLPKNRARIFKLMISLAFQLGQILRRVEQ